LVALLLSSVSAQTTCQYTAYDGSFFDMTGMTLTAGTGDYQGTDGVYNFTMNVCAPCSIGGTCTNTISTLCQYSNNFQTYVTSIAKLYASGMPDPTWSLITPATPSNGIQLSAMNGDATGQCGGPRNVTMQFWCLSTGSFWPSFQVIEDDLCDYHTVMYHPSACPLPYVVNGTLEPQVNTTLQNQWSYWAYYVDVNATELNIKTNQMSTGGYAAIYLRRGAPPTNAAFDRRDTLNQPYKEMYIRKSPADPPLQQGWWYIGILGAGAPSITFNISITTYLCPGNCSGHGTCNAPVCLCDTGYLTPQLDCSAPVVDVQNGNATSGAITGARIAYYRLTVQDPNVYSLVINVIRTSGTALGTVMVTENAWPTMSNALASIADEFKPSNTYQLTLNTPQVNLGGTYVVGVQGSQDNSWSFLIQLNIYDCPNNCSEQGICNAANQTCSCYSGWQLLPDCSLRDQVLQVGQDPYRWTFQPGGTTYFRAIVSEEIALLQMDLEIQVLAPSGLLPNIYVLLNDLPTPENYFIMNPSPPGLTTDGTYTIATVPGLNLAAGNWYFAIYNPADVPVTGGITLYFLGWCPGSCIDNGGCDELYPSLCYCNPGWQGAVCDVAVPTLHDQTSVGLTAGLVILFTFLGFFSVILLLRYRPHLCQKEEDAKLSMALNYS